MESQCILLQACVTFLLLGAATTQPYSPGLIHARLQDSEWGREGLQTAGSNASQPVAPDNWSLIKGFASLGLCVIGFGSSFVPIKNTDTGDGMFFQWVFCGTLWLGSFLVHVLLGCPRFWLLSVLGGALWGIGNLTAVPILKTIGLGLGYLIWSTFSLLMGWATARFGWFGLDEQIVPSPTLNYLGTALAALSALILMLVKSEGEVGIEMEEGEREEREPLLQQKLQSANCKQLVINENGLADSSDGNWTNRLSAIQRKIIGCLLATCAGLLYGGAYTPDIYIKNKALKNYTEFIGASQYDLDYIFPFTTGVYVMSSVAFFVYCMAVKNRPNLPARCILPAFFSGCLLIVCNCCWFVACYHVGTMIAFPIATAGPSLVSLSWSVFYFREIKGTKNFLLLAVVLVTILSGVALITVSKIK